MDSYLDPTTIAANLAEVPVQTQASDAIDFLRTEAVRLRIVAKDATAAANEYANDRADSAWFVNGSRRTAETARNRAAEFDRAAAALEPAAWTKCGEGRMERKCGRFMLEAWRSDDVWRWEVRRIGGSGYLYSDTAPTLAAAKAAALAVGGWS